MKAPIQFTAKGLGFNRLGLFLFILFTCGSANGQVDPSWLKSWNIAQQSKPSKIASSSRIGPENEPGKPLIIKGRIFNPDGTTVAAVLVHAYHRDAKGYDFGEKDSELSTWKLQGWAKTDKNGCFEFRTIKPTADHLGREGAHIHFTTLSEKYGKQWAPKVFFADDPLLKESQRMRSEEAGQFGWICEIRERDGIQFIEVNIKLKNKQDF